VQFGAAGVRGDPSPPPIAPSTRPQVFLGPTAAYDPQWAKAAGVRLRAAVRDIPAQHDTLTRLLTALESGVDAQLKAAVADNTSFFFRDARQHSVELPESLWGFHTPYGFCPVLLITKHAVAVTTDRLYFVPDCMQFHFNTDHIEQWDDKVSQPLPYPSTRI
jgi:hypothetical protein